MRVVGASHLPEFCRAHRHAEGALKAWLKEARTAEWTKPADIKAQFPSASILEENLVVFRIRGSQLAVRVDYSHRLVFVVNEQRRARSSINVGMMEMIHDR